ncbi:MAG: hypothetical protein AAGA66_06855 [Bacteroidota bacterium]
MAKIFRKARQKLLIQKKVKSYLLYAIAEIILVVIGILLALQINALNQSRQRTKLEKTLLNQIKFEMLEIYEDVWRDAANLKLGEKSHENLRDHIVQDRPYADSLCFSFHWLKVDEYIYPTTATYGRFKEVGLDIIKNDTIRIHLQSLYEGHFPRLAKNNAYTPDISEVFNDYYLNSFKPNSDMALTFHFQLEEDTVGSRIYSDVSYHFPRTSGQRKDQSTIGYVPLDFEALKKDPKFHMLLEQTRRYRSNKLRHYSSVRSIMKEVVEVIERELK